MNKRLLPSGGVASATGSINCRPNCLSTEYPYTGGFPGIFNVLFATRVNCAIDEIEHKDSHSPPNKPQFMSKECAHGNKPVKMGNTIRLLVQNPDLLTVNRSTFAK